MKSLGQFATGSRTTRLTIVVAAISFVTACGSNGRSSESGVDQAEVDIDAFAGATDPTLRPLGIDVYVETGDIDALRRRGKIRFANVARAHIEELPRLRWGMPHEDALAREFADRLQLELQIQEFATDAAAQQALREGLVDGIVGRSGDGIAPPGEGIAESTAFNRIPGVLVSRTGSAPQTLADLSGRTVSFGRQSSLLGAGDLIKQRNSSVKIDTIDVKSAEDAIDMILDGRVDVTLVERWVAKAVAEVHPDLEIGAEFGEIVYTAAVRESNPDLLRLINDFAFQVLPVGEAGSELLGDLDEIKERRVLRVLTVNGPSSYYVYKGELVGFDLDLVRMFADEQDLIMQMVVAPSTELLELWLERGIGDMIGSGIISTAIENTSAVVATRPYHDVHPVIIARRDLGLTSAEHLAGRVVVVSHNNPYLPLIQAVADEQDFRLETTPDAESTTQLLTRLEDGDAEITVLESHLAEAELPDHPTLEIIHRVDDTPGRAWAVRTDQPELLAALNGFLDREVGRVTHAVLIRKYFRRDTRRVERPGLQEDGSLSRWDDLIQQYTIGTDFDWRLLTAQMFQESRFDPEARSHAGAYGLMQMMPQTARQMGVSDISDPEQQIKAGAEYMEWLYSRFSSDLSTADRLAFTLAAYNAGWGHVRDARHVAELTGRDPDRWFDSVEHSMLSLSDPDVYSFTRHGYVRGREPVNYVRRINELGLMYFRMAPSN